MARIRCCNPDSHQFFASAVAAGCRATGVFWRKFCSHGLTAVRQIDSSIAGGWQAAGSGPTVSIVLMHAGTSGSTANVHALLSVDVPATRIASDLDRALETVENLLLQRHLPPFQAEDHLGNLLWPAPD